MYQLIISVRKRATDFYRTFLNVVAVSADLTKIRYFVS